MQSLNCPVCEHENIKGIETCDECGAVLHSEVLDDEPHRDSCSRAVPRCSHGVSLDDECRTCEDVELHRCVSACATTTEEWWGDYVADRSDVEPAS